LNETDPTFQKRFLDRLSKAYGEIRDNWEGDDLNQELELLSWTREYLTGWNKVTGQGAPFLHGQSVTSSTAQGDNAAGVERGTSED
jgi:hypothetical protein